MKVIFLTGSHTRHSYIAWRLHKANLLSGLLVEEREEFVPSPHAGLKEVDHHNFVRHFKDRSESEERFLSTPESDSIRGIPVLRVTMEELNSDKVKEWIQKQNPDVVLSYGVHKINKNILDILPKYAWNIHGGLSPWYRGNITMFWPFYFLQPNFAGMTVHHLTAQLDGGPIVHHSVPELVRGDGIHDVASRAVIQVAEDLIQILILLQDGKEINGQPQKNSGKLFTGVDWKPQHLRLVYNHFDNDIVDRFLDGEFGVQEPPLIKAF
ncbi:methionyl-tRNA formyltransferase [Paenibacillus sp. LMG 31461]|uniref:Methionyl-tRNA formyltransferase n=1 Tax=Paenibacillus plantarum TaxID=2654975 RepID=A0ABX1XE15_9BACL|nr:formyltransferase family protein [Paenibacillus plantarum]NOU66727.1 methionyl-tRNA formyltransferase [Paenibacillus plantarum]